jgi:peptidoglycan/LPS O-acetylase OafA/YrhL
MPKQRIAYLETARGLACLLLVSFHVVGNKPWHGLRISGDHWMHVVNDVLGDVRMPLFSLISGIVFSAAVRSRREWGDKVLKKVRRLLLPLFTVATLQYLVQLAIGEGENMPLWQIYFLPYEHFWFLQSTFLLMIAMLTASLFVGNAAKWAPLAAIFCAATYLIFDRWQPDVFSSYKALYLGPFFFLGVSVNYYTDPARNALSLPSVKTASLVFLLMGLVVEGAVILGVVPSQFEKLSSLVVSLSVVTFILSWKLVAKPLVWIGGYSYAIYLFHVFFTAGSRIALQRIWPSHPLEIAYAVGLAAGIFLPIALSIALLRRSETALLFLGVDTCSRQSKKAAVQAKASTAGPA